MFAIDSVEDERAGHCYRDLLLYTRYSIILSLSQSSSSICKFYENPHAQLIQF